MTERIKTALHAAKILKDHNKWRRGGDGPSTDPTKLGLAIDLVVKFIEQLAAESQKKDLK